ncbi:MAG: S8 family serine peptidase, partial [Candidatus Nanopelagicaceae bacterium]
VLGAYIPNPTSAAFSSGTSMASPFVAGAVATYLGFEPNATPAMATEYIIQKSTKNVLTGLAVGTPNRLLYVPPDDNPVSLSISPSNSVSRASTVTLSFNAGQTGTANFRANGREIIGCKSVATVSEIAQCTWRPSRHGNNVVEVRITPSATSISSTTRRSLSLTVIPRSGSR